MSSKNIVLIGMPGCGKSTVGVLLAKRLGLGFTDTDLIIQQQTGRTLQNIVDGDGYQALRRVEAQVLLALDVRGHVIATGGSAVYSAPAMEHLSRSGVVVFLDISLEEVKRRIGDHSLRGISRQPDQTLDHLFRERFELYRRCAQICVRAGDYTPEQVCDAVVAELSRNTSAPAVQ